MITEVQGKETPTPPTAAEVIFAKLPDPEYQERVIEYCQQYGVGLEDGVIMLLMRGTDPGQFFVEQLPGEAERSKLQEYCMIEKLTPSAAILSLVNRALESPVVLEEARRSPFIAQAQEQLSQGASARASGSAFRARTMKQCEVCGSDYVPRNNGQKYCENRACWAAGAGLPTAAERERQASGGPPVEQQIAELRGMFQQLMHAVKPQLQEGVRH